MPDTFIVKIEGLPEYTVRGDVIPPVGARLYLEPSVNGGKLSPPIQVLRHEYRLVAGEEVDDGGSLDDGDEDNDIDEDDVEALPQFVLHVIAEIDATEARIREISAADESALKALRVP